MAEIRDFVKALMSNGINDNNVVNSLAEDIAERYGAFMGDEASNFGESGYMFTANSYDDVGVFTWDYLREYR